MSDINRHFSDSYGLARKKFLDAAKAAGLDIESVQNTEANGPRGEPLYTDIARLGLSLDDGAENVLVLSSATHGAEGFCGSGIQVGLLREEVLADLPPKTAVVMIHAMNPYGFAHVRRVTEGNVDLNRNVVDHAAGTYPPETGYADVHGLLCPPDLITNKAAYDAAIMARIEEHGLPAFQMAVSGGQYTHPDGLFYGGRAPTWSNRMWHGVIERHMRGHRRIACVDFHTGLGPYGFGELIVTRGVPQARDWWGTEGVADIAAGESVSAPIRGDVSSALAVLGEGPEITFAALEYGTRDIITVLDAHRADNWLHHHGDPEGPEGEAIRAQMLHAMYPDDDAWRQMVWERAVFVVSKALEGVAGR
jgi:hypothetical protein